MVGDDELLLEAQLMEDVDRLFLWSLHTDVDAHDVVLVGDDEELAGEDHAEADAPEVGGHDESDLGAPLAPVVALQFEGSIGHDTVVMHRHHPLDQGSGCLQNPFGHDLGIGHVAAQVAAFTRVEVGEEGQ